MADQTPLTFGSVIAVRRRASAQQRLRREATKLDTLAVKKRIPVARDTEPVGVTADQLRLVADLLDHPTWGQMEP